MRILIVSGILAPEAGGPATYAPRLASELAHAGHRVTVLSFSAKPYYEQDGEYPFKAVRVVRRGKIANRIRFFFAALAHARRCDLIYSLDWFAAGLPAALAARAVRVPYVVRVGGDYLWEQRYLESGEEPLTLREFYARGIHRRFSYAPFFRSIRFVLRGACAVVFNSDPERELYIEHYGLAPERTATIFNALPSSREAAVAGASNEFVFWGRFIVMKNLVSLVRAFKSGKNLDMFRLTLIGEGPQKELIGRLIDNLDLRERVSIEPARPFKEVIERVRGCRAFILPSWTDVSPNQVAEALAIGLPALVTKENYLSFASQLPLTIDPRSIPDIAAKLDVLADDEGYREFRERFLRIEFSRTWSDVCREHLELFSRALGQEIAPFRVLQIGADRSKRGILFPGSPAAKRQEAYARELGRLDIIGFSLRRDGAKPFAAPYLAVYPTNSRCRLLWGLDAMRRARRSLIPDVVSAQDPFETGLAAWCVAKMRSVPLHVQVHTDFLSPEYARHTLLNRVRVRVAGFVLRRAARVRVVSERVKREIEARYRLRAPITVLPIYADLETYRIAPLDPELAIRFAAFAAKLLVVARLEPEKNIELAIRAFADAAPERACLIIVGEGSARERLETLARATPASGRIFFEGSQDAARYYPVADLVLVTSKYEGYGLVIVEALAAGKPVLSTDVGGAREAGAIVANADRFADELKNWYVSGPREGKLLAYPYANFEEYVAKYCEDIKATAVDTRDQKSVL